MRRFGSTLLLFGMAVAGALAAPRLMAAPAREMHVAEPVVAAPIAEVRHGAIATIPELDEPTPARPPRLQLPPDPPPHADPCPACGMG